MTRGFAQFEDVVADPDFPGLDLALRRGRHVDRDDSAWYALLLDAGEAIGVGASLMMVVLTERERDSNLLRAQEQHGSMRFLFLDEANRLSLDNLGVLFELCNELDLQLLIAAPEVARSEGNTTCRLVKHVAEDSREEVAVSGRPAIATEVIEAE